MKSRNAVLALSLAALSLGCALPYAQTGIVEQVQEVAAPSRFDTFAELFEHAVRPQTADRLLIRLDDGSAVTLEQDGMQRFEAGQRVRVFAHADGASVALE